jgi:hypothetical protein
MRTLGREVARVAGADHQHSGSLRESLAADDVAVSAAVQNLSRRWRGQAAAALTIWYQAYAVRNRRLCRRRINLVCSLA